MSNTDNLYADRTSPRDTVPSAPPAAQGAASCGTDGAGRTDDRLGSSHTALPAWQTASTTGYTASQAGSGRFYALLSGWAVVLGLLVAVGVTHGVAETPATVPQPGSAFYVAEDSLAPVPQQPLDGFPEVRLLAEPGDHLPRSFRQCRPNALEGAETLLPAARILAAGERPLRVLHIGDSHVAGQHFPQAVRAELVRCLGEAQSGDEGSGVWFSYVGKNGATAVTFTNEVYYSAFADKAPDLIVLSLGTNEAHGMGYREDLHERQLEAFLAGLERACPGAVVLLTTPPGDYLTTRYVDYRKMGRSKRRTKQVRTAKRPNPMSGRCARFLSDYAGAHSMACWNLYEICGGDEMAQRNWVAGHYMRPDRVHFEPKGYQLQGTLLAEALVRALAGGARP